MSDPSKQNQADYDIVVGQKVGYQRAMRGMTQQGLANELGVGISLIQRTESGRRTATTTELNKISKILKVDIETLT